MVYAGDSEPLAVFPLKKLDLVPPLPLELEWMRGDKGPDTLTLTILGKYQAVLRGPLT